MPNYTSTGSYVQYSGATSSQISSSSGYYGSQYYGSSGKQRCYLKLKTKTT